MPKSIQEVSQKIKSGSVSAGWLVPAIVLLVGIASFGLGRLSRGDALQPVTVSFHKLHAQEPKNIGGWVVASKSGEKYHFPWCTGAESIKAANRLWFKDESSARKAGYTPAGNCKGLK